MPLDANICLSTRQKESEPQTDEEARKEVDEYLEPGATQKEQRKTKQRIKREMFIRKVHIALAAVVLVGQMIAFSAPAFAAEKTTSQQPTTTQNQAQPQQNDKTLKDKTPINEGVVVDSAHNPVDDPSTNDSSDASKTQGIVSTHCRPGFELVNNQCTPKDDKSSASNSNEDPILVHCSPGTGCSKEDSDAPKDNDKSNSNNSNGDPILIHCGLGTDCSKEDASDQKAATASAEVGRLANNSGTIHGCPYDYNYDEEFDICAPGNGSFAFWPVILGDEPWPDSAGGYVGLTGGFVQDSLTSLGLGLQIGLGHYVEDALVDFGDGGGPIGWAIQGLGYTLGATGDVGGVLVEGAGQVVGAVADGVGDVIDDVGGAIGDALGSIF